MGARAHLGGGGEFSPPRNIALTCTVLVYCTYNVDRGFFSGEIFQRLNFLLGFIFITMTTRR